MPKASTTTTTLLQTRHTVAIRSTAVGMVAFLCASSGGKFQENIRIVQVRARTQDLGQRGLRRRGMQELVCPREWFPIICLHLMALLAR